MVGDSLTRLHGQSPPSSSSSFCLKKTYLNIRLSYWYIHCHCRHEERHIFLGEGARQRRAKYGVIDIEEYKKMCPCLHKHVTKRTTRQTYWTVRIACVSLFVFFSLTRWRGEDIYRRAERVLRESRSREKVRQEQRL